MFHSSKITDLKKILEEQGVVLDFSESTSFTYPFNNSTITNIGVIDCRSCNALSYLFYSATCVENVDKVIVSEKNTYSSTAFYDMKKLENIRFEGVIAATINIQWSPKMNAESAKSIIKCLANYLGTGNADVNTLSLSNNTWALLDAEGATSPNGNTWREYVFDMGWRIT